MKVLIQELVSRINRRQKTIESLLTQTAENANRAVMEAILQGRDLVALKMSCKHGDWMDTLHKFCPKVSDQWVRRLMKLATKAEEIPNLEQAPSIRAALLLCEPDKEDQEDSTPKRWPEHQEGMGRAWKFIEFTVRHPIAGWPKPTLDELRQDLAPIVTVLWPDKFEAAPTPGKESIRPAERHNR